MKLYTLDEDLNRFIKKVIDGHINKIEDNPYGIVLFEEIGNRIILNKCGVPEHNRTNNFVSIECRNTGIIINGFTLYEYSDPIENFVFIFDNTLEGEYSILVEPYLSMPLSIELINKEE